MQDILNRRNRRMGISDTPADEQQGALESPQNNPDSDGKALFPAYSKEESGAAPTKMVAYFKVSWFMKYVLYLPVGQVAMNVTTKGLKITLRNVQCGCY